MARNHFEEGLGVLPFEFTHTDSSGEPPRDRGVILVEFWKTALSFWNHRRPGVQVTARFELWIYREESWHRVTHAGRLEAIADRPMVKRWASTTGFRRWEGNVVLDGWQK